MGVLCTKFLYPFRIISFPKYIEMMDKTRYMGAWHSVNDIQAQAGEKRWREILNMIESKICNIQIVEIPYKIRAWTVRKI